VSNKSASVIPGLCHIKDDICVAVVESLNGALVILGDIHRRKVTLEGGAVESAEL